MSEKHKNKNIRKLAAGTAALVLAAGIAGKAEAGPDQPSKGAKIEAIAIPEKPADLNKLGAETLKKLFAAQSEKFYYGSLNIYEAGNPNRLKAAILNPLVIPLVPNPKHPRRVASPEYAFGFWTKVPVAGLGVTISEPGIRDGYKLQLFSYRHGMEFRPFSRELSGEAEVINEVKYPTKKGLAVLSPLRPNGSEWRHPGVDEPLSIGFLVAWAAPEGIKPG